MIGTRERTFGAFESNKMWLALEAGRLAGHREEVLLLQLPSPAGFTLCITHLTVCYSPHSDYIGEKRELGGVSIREAGKR